MEFVHWLEAKMEEDGLSQSDLARKTGLTRQAINHLLNGKSKTPSIDTMKKLADAFHTPVENIYEIAGMSLMDSQDLSALTRAIVYVLDKLPPEDQEEVLEYAKHRLNRSKKNGSTKNAKVTT